MLIQQDRLPIRDILLYGLLPGFLKKLVYRLKGYKIGKNVSISAGSVVCGDDVSIGEGTQIGFFTIIRGKRIRIGSHVTIGATTFLDTPQLDIGDGSRINEQVFIGGLQFPDSRLVMGKNCQIMQRSFLNPTRGITIGDDSGIGGDCLIFGHNSWLSQFEGYAVEFSPIEIGRSVSVSWRVFLLPGTKIEDGAVIGANSLVRGTIPSRCLAAGFPARVVSRYPDFPRPVSDDEKGDMFRHIVHEMVDFFIDSGLSCEKLGNGVYEVSRHRRSFLFRRKDLWRIKVNDQMNLEDVIPRMDEIDVYLSLGAIPAALRQKMKARRILWIDLEKKERPDLSNELGEEVILYLKRYGVRLFRVDT